MLVFTVAQEGHLSLFHLISAVNNAVQHIQDDSLAHSSHLGDINKGLKQKEKEKKR